MLKVFISITSVASFFLLILLLNLSNPANAGPFGILMIFIFSYLALTGLTTLIIYYTSRLIAHLSTFFIASRPYEVIAVSRAYYFSTVIAAAPVMTVGLQSVGAVGFYDIVLVTLFTVVGCFYVSKRVK